MAKRLKMTREGYIIAPAAREETEPFIMNNDIWSQVFLFSNVKDVPAISCVSKTWKAILELVEQELWASLFAKVCPRLTEIVKNYYESDPTSTKQWKLMYKTRVASPYQASYINKDLQKKTWKLSLVRLVSWPFPTAAPTARDHITKKTVLSMPVGERLSTLVRKWGFQCQMGLFQRSRTE